MNPGMKPAGGTLGILIPPSIGLIVYGVLVEESIGRLYLAGFIPGFMLAAVMMLMIILAAKIWPGIAPPEQLAGWRDRFVGLLGMIPVLLIISVVLGSIYLGLATPTEAAAFGVSGALALAVINNSGPAMTAWTSWSTTPEGHPRAGLLTPPKKSGNKPSTWLSYSSSE